MDTIVFDRKTFKIGGSFAVALPSPIANSLGIRKGTKLKIWVDRENKIIIQKCEDGKN